MWFIHLFCLLFIVHSRMFCYALPTGILKGSSKGVQIKEPHENASLNEQVVHHAKEQISHERKAKKLLKSKSYKESHQDAASYHLKQGKVIHKYIQDNVPYGVEGIHHG